jgi:hypothetical protein
MALLMLRMLPRWVEKGVNGVIHSGMPATCYDWESFEREKIVGVIARPSTHP